MNREERMIYWDGEGVEQRLNRRNQSLCDSPSDGAATLRFFPFAQALVEGSPSPEGLREKLRECEARNRELEAKLKDYEEKEKQWQESTPRQLEVKSDEWNPLSMEKDIDTSMDMSRSYSDPIAIPVGRGGVK